MKRPKKKPRAWRGFFTTSRGRSALVRGLGLLRGVVLRVMLGVVLRMVRGRLHRRGRRSRRGRGGVLGERGAGNGGEGDGEQSGAQLHSELLNRGWVRPGGQIR